MGLIISAKADQSYLGHLGILSESKRKSFLEVAQATKIIV